MIKRLLIENFRGLQQVALEHLRSVNLIVGGNDTGKTSVLEALVMLLGDSQAVGSLPHTFRVNQSGGQSRDDSDRENFWPWLFYNRDPENRIRIRAQTDSNESIEITTLQKAVARFPAGPTDPVLVRLEGSDEKWQPSGAKNQAGVELLRMSRHQFLVGGGSSPKDFRVAVLSTKPSNPAIDAENYNQVALLADGERRIEEIVREIEPRLKRLRYAKLPGTTTPLIFADVGLSRAVPAPQMGQAFNRILHIYTHILAQRINVLLVDEIENGIFSESMPVVWRGLMAICEQEGVQIFATTHSRECVMAATAVAHERGRDELSVQRLQLVKGKVEAVHLGIQHLELAAEMGLEVRS
jgi:hypothetical protein